MLATHASSSNTNKLVALPVCPWMDLFTVALEHSASLSLSLLAEHNFFVTPKRIIQQSVSHKRKVS